MTKSKKSKKNALKGSGDYKQVLSDLRNIVSQNKKYIPRALGAAAGIISGAGAQRGWEMGSKVSKELLGWGKYRRNLISGSGDYGVPWSVIGNTLTTEGNIPKVHSLGDQGMRVVHEEAIGVVTSSTGFTNTSYAMNPGLLASFPWLSRMASNFQQWRPNGIVYTFKSQMTNAVANFQSLGSVTIAANLNPADRLAASQIEIEQLKFAAVSKPSLDIVAPIECAPGQRNTVSYIRTGGVPLGASVIDYDHGTVQVAVNACPSDGVVLGRLYVSYDITLLNPKMAVGAAGSAIYTLTSPTTANYLGSSSPTKVTDSIGLTFNTAPNSFIRFPYGMTGVFILSYWVKGTSAALTTAVGGTPTNCAFSGTIKPYGGSVVQINTGAPTSETQFYQTVIEIPDPTKQAVFAISSGSLPTSANGTLIVDAVAFAVPGVAPVSFSSPSGLSRLEQPPCPEDDDDEKEDYSNVPPAVPSAAFAIPRKALRA